jgi:glyoxylase-like metal-dependent hydrolase (beta-lactamase superfamily II)
MQSTRRFQWFTIALLFTGGCARSVPGEKPPPIARDHEREGYEAVLRLPGAPATAALVLAGEYMAAGRDSDGLVYFRDRHAHSPDRAIFEALEGLFALRVSASVPLLQRLAWAESAIGQLDHAARSREPAVRLLRGLAFAVLPERFQKAEVAIAELQWVLANPDLFQTSVERGAQVGLARAFRTLGKQREADLAQTAAGVSRIDDSTPAFLGDFSWTVKEGYRFARPRLVKRLDRIYVAEAFDFSDICFVVTDTSVVAIDAGATVEAAKEALAALRTVTPLPLSHVLVTHSHWDHIGGLAAYRAEGAKVIASHRFSEELAIGRNKPMPLDAYQPKVPDSLEYTPDTLVTQRTALTIGNVRFELYPFESGETVDALGIHLPSQSTLFVGDAFMPYLGMPHAAEGSIEGFVQSGRLVELLRPTLLIHGHTPLNTVFAPEGVPLILKAVLELQEETKAAFRRGLSATEVLDLNILPPTVRQMPAIAVPYLVMRPHVVERIFRSQGGYWARNGEGLEHLSPSAWATTLDLLGGESSTAFERCAGALVHRGDAALALQISELGLLRYPENSELRKRRAAALEMLMLKYQATDPEKFAVYAQMAQIELAPIPAH